MSTSSLEAPFAIGHTAEVYSWEEGTILRRYFELSSGGSKEFEMWRVVNAAAR